MLTTPLGDIEIYVDDNKVEYMEKNIRVSDKLCPDVSGRYAIKIDFIPDGKIHTISCKIKGHVSSEKDGIELGERLELKSFYKDNTKLSIGMEETKTTKYVFGIAWIENVTTENDVQTWYGADPTLF